MEGGSLVQLPLVEESQAEAPSQPVQPGQQAGLGLDLTIDTDFLKSTLCFIKIAEFVSTTFASTELILERLNGQVTFTVNGSNILAFVRLTVHFLALRLAEGLKFKFRRCATPN